MCIESKAMFWFQSVTFNVTFIFKGKTTRIIHSKQSIGWYIEQAKISDALQNISYVQFVSISFRIRLQNVCHHTDQTSHDLYLFKVRSMTYILLMPHAINEITRRTFGVCNNVKKMINRTIIVLSLKKIPM